LPAFSTTYGLRLYQEEFQVRPTKTPIRYQENKGGTTFDHTDFTPGPQAVTATLRFALRYSGVHAAMLAHAVGTLGTTGPSGTPPVYTHTLDGGGSGKFNSVSFVHHRPINDAGTSFIETQLLGAKVGRMRLTQSVGQPFIICEMDIVAQEAKQLTTFGSGYPPDSGGYSPTEAVIHTSHVLDTTGAPPNTPPRNFILTARSASTTPAYVQLEEWTMELNNFPEQLGVISNVQRQSNPARGQVREVTGSFVMEQDSQTAIVEAAYGLTAADPSDDFKLIWSFENPANVDHELQIDVSQAYITQAERGTSGTGPQRRRYNFAAHAQGSQAVWSTAFPLRMIFRNTTQGPYGSTMGGGIAYANHV